MAELYLEAVRYLRILRITNKYDYKKIKESSWQFKVRPIGRVICTGSAYSDLPQDRANLSFLLAGGEYMLDGIRMDGVGASAVSSELAYAFGIPAEPDLWSAIHFESIVRY